MYIERTGKILTHFIREVAKWRFPVEIAAYLCSDWPQISTEIHQEQEKTERKKRKKEIVFFFQVNLRMKLRGARDELR